MRYNSKLVWIGIALLLALTAVNTYTLHQALSACCQRQLQSPTHTATPALETELPKESPWSTPKLANEDSSTPITHNILRHIRKRLKPSTPRRTVCKPWSPVTVSSWTGCSRSASFLTKSWRNWAEPSNSTSQGVLPEARTLVLSNVGKSLMDEIRQRLDAIAQTESERQGARVQRTLESTVFASRSLTYYRRQYSGSTSLRVAFVARDEKVADGNTGSCRSSGNGLTRRVWA